MSGKKLDNLKKILQELKETRKEMKRDQKKNQKEIRNLKKVLLGKIEEKCREMREKIEENDEEAEERNRDIQRKMGIAPANGEVRNIPIRKAIIGEWVMAEFENFEGYGSVYGHNLQEFAQNVKFSMKNGKLKKTMATFQEQIEGKDLFVKDNHVKSFYSEDNWEDRYILHGKLHIDTYCDEEVWKQIYVKIV